METTVRHEAHRKFIETTVRHYLLFGEVLIEETARAFASVALLLSLLLLDV